MKKFIVLFCMLSPLFLHAQQFESSRKSISYTQDDSYTQKIRVFDQQTTIALSKKSGSIYIFYLIVDGSNTANIFEMPTGYEISDFQILGDLVYFCGYHNNSSGIQIGIIGNFDINNAFYGSGNVEITDINNTLHVDKIKAYLEPANPTFTHVVGIGKNIGTLNNDHSCFIDFNNKTNYPNWDYNVFEHSYSLSNVFENITDIELTNKFVVTVSSIANTSWVLLRRYYNDDPSDISLQHKFYANLNSTGSIYTPLDRTFFVEKLYDDNVSIVSSAADNTSEFTYINVVNLNNGTPVLNYNRRIEHNDKNIIRDLEYSIIDKNLLILTSVNDVGNTDWKDVIFYAELDPSATLPQTIKAIFWSNYSPKYPYLNSLCIYKDFHYSTIGLDPNNYELFIFNKDKQYDLPNSCNKYDYLQMNNIIPQSSFNPFSTLNNHTSNSANFIIFSQPNNVVNVHFNCYNTH